MRQLIADEWATHRGFWLSTFACMVCVYAAIAVMYVYASAVIG